MMLPVLGGISGCNRRIVKHAQKSSIHADSGIMLRMSAVLDEVKDRLRLSFCGLDFSSPLVLLSGCVGFGEEYTRVAGFSNSDAGAIVLKGTTLKPRLGNPPHRVFETPAGVLKANGL